MTPAERLVIDASVAVKWVVEEEHSEAAARLIDDQIRHLVPPHFWIEVANALWRKASRGELPAGEPALKLAELSAARLDVVDAPLLHERALELALLLDHPVHDAAYVAVALWESARLVTADGPLRDAIDAAGLGEHVLWIEDVA